MDAIPWATILGGLIGMLWGWAMIFVFCILRGNREKRWAHNQRRVDPSAWEPMFGRAHDDWYRWFAWRPVRTLDRGLVWLRPVWRRRVFKHSYLPGPSASWYQNLVELKYIFD